MNIADLLNSGKNIVDFTFRLGREHLQKFETPTATSAAVAQLSPAKDPQNQIVGTDRSLNNTSRVLIGCIVDTVAVGGLYKINLERGKQMVIGVACTGTSLGIYGAKQLATYLPGTLVQCVSQDSGGYVYILGAVPPRNIDRRYAQQTVLHGATRSRVDDAHKKPFRLSDDLVSATAGRIFDSAGGGESGWISETGVRVFIDSFMASIGLDEMSSLSFFYQDMFTKFAAYNYQHWTSVSETEAFNNQDEAHHWNGYATYPWENLGLTARADISTVQTPKTWQIDKPWLGKVDLLNPQTMPWHRYREWFGYLGQGSKRTLVALPIGFSDMGDKGTVGQTSQESGERAQPMLYGKGSVQPGLADHFTTLGGHVGIQSTKAISITKRGVISTPTRLNKPDASLGDRPADYKFSGLLGDGPEHKITGDIATDATTVRSQKLAGASDMRAYLYNYANLQPFLYHRKDYSVPEESAAAYAGGKSAEVANVAELASAQAIDTEKYKKTLNIDHRYGEQKFYTLEGGIDFLDDGSVLIHDGCGGEIRMSGGNIDISCPGDISLRSGRGTHVLAGRDFTARARNELELSATLGDIRLKAEKSFYALAGNGGTGGIMLESLGSGAEYDFTENGTAAAFSGIIVKCPDSQFVAHAGSSYLRTTSGPLILDAAKGRQPVLTYASQCVNYVAQDQSWYFGTAGDTVSGPSAYIAKDSAGLPGRLTVVGGIDLAGDLRGTGNVIICGYGASGSGGLWGSLGDATDSVRNELQTAATAVSKTRPKKQGQQAYDTFIGERLYQENQAGNDDTMKLVTFSFRTDEQYNTDGYLTYEARWQQLARLAGQSTRKWQESAVYTEAGATYPYPGTNAFTRATLVQQNLTIFDAANGRARDREMSTTGPAEIYANPAYASQIQVNLSEYTVI